MSDWETRKAKMAREAEPESPDWEALRAQITGEVEPETGELETERVETPMPAEDRRSETPRARFVPGAEPEGRARETAKPQIARQAEPEERGGKAWTPQITEESTLARRGRVIGRVHPLVFGLVGLLLVSQVYTWVRLEQLSRLDRQPRLRLLAAQEALQKDVEKQMAALDQVYQQAASRADARIAALEQTYETTLPRGREMWKPGTAAPKRGEPKQNKGTEKPKAERQSVFSAGSGSSVDPHTPPVAAQASRRQETSNSGQDLYAVHPDPPANRHEPSLPQPSVDSKKNEPQNKSAGNLGAKPGQSRTLIARDHDELEKLEKLGERDYVEFTLLRSGARQEVVAGISLKLTKTDARASHCQISVYADDYELPVSQALDDPVSFPIRAGWQSVELVVNEIKQDRVVGYLSAPKGVLIAGK